MSKSLFATRLLGWFCAAGCVALSVAAPAVAFQAEALQSVVSVLPVWPGQAKGGNPDLPPGVAPEGTAVAVLPGGYLATALHVVDRALAVTVRLADGRELPAEVAGRDPPTDLALLKVDSDIVPLEVAPAPALGSPVCAVGNQFGLDLSVTCGVVSALRRSGTGFNPIEDFVQTDATVNPGASGGALLDDQGRLVGLLSAIFAKESDASIGVNFAVSSALLLRVAEDLATGGKVIRGRPGLRFAELGPEARAQYSGVRIKSLRAGGSAEEAGFQVGDVITAIDERPLRKVSDAIAAIHLKRPGEMLTFALLRDGAATSLSMALDP